ncbi:hypothetical protein AA100600_0815 [Gluconobacter thailandicus F149-1 = NBRC 100600]|nr:hypothetical protein AA100600_0815 [Gluconobacter thailandicus F149-1 = NBRC 100600]
MGSLAGKCIFEDNIFAHSRTDMGRIRLQTERATINTPTFTSFRKFAQITPDHINRNMPFSSEIGREDAPVAS